MRKRLTGILAVTAIVVSGLYIVSPIMAAHKLRQAIHASETTKLKDMVEWEPLRSSIRATISKNANLLPVATELARRVRPTFWQRVRSVFGHSMLDRFIDTYITPEGLPKLYRAKTRWHDRFESQAFQAPITKAAIVPEQLIRAWQRIKRAEFVSPFRFVIEVQDRYKTTRFIESTFKLTSISLSGFDWKLIGISIRNSAPDKPRLARLNGF